jgi:hypothetical protein
MSLEIKWDNSLEKYKEVETYENDIPAKKETKI